VLGRFIKIDTDRITKGFVTFARICVEIDLSQGLPNRILIDWIEDDPYTQLVDYENIAFMCRSCQQTWHLQVACPLSPTPFSSPGARKRANGWKDPKNRKSCSNSSSDNKQASQRHLSSSTFYNTIAVSNKYAASNRRPKTPAFGFSTTS
jgi:hypothetical protein